MRWDRLFDDLEAQVAAQERLELDSEVAERTRAERAKVALTDRLVGSLGEPVSGQLLGGLRVSGVLSEVGKDWFLVEEGATGVLVPIGAVVFVSGLGRRPRGSAVARRLALGAALRGVSRDRRVVRVHDVGGGVAIGTIDAVGADALDLGEHAPDEPRRAGNVRGSRVIPFAACAAVVSAP